MPSNLIKTKEDEKLWEEAKRQTDKSGIDPKTPRYYAYTTTIYQKMKEGKNK